MKTITKIFLGAMTVALIAVLAINIMVFVPLLTGGVDAPPFPADEIKAALARQEEEKGLAVSASGGEEECTADLASKEDAGDAEAALNTAVNGASATSKPAEQKKDTSEPAIKTETVLPLSTQAPAQTPAPTPTPTPAPASTSAPAPAKQVYSVVGPDGRTYTDSSPIYIVCRCGEKFSSAAGWQAHRDWYSAYRCACGGNFSSIGGWEAHAGIYDSVTYIYTGKSYADAASEGHGLTNEHTYTSEYNAHNGWATSNF